MVKVYQKEVFVGDYGLTIYLETEVGLITLLTNFPRINKWIGLRSICSLEIEPGIRIESTEEMRLHVRNINEFIHRVMMKIEDGVLYSDPVTKEVIDRYRRENYGTV